ncbi:MAG: DNA gyrase inhibitor YacG [Pseudomonadota bacterium]|nr:DNA gyrase inhibitor YacG [Pseudomonadota bacterium]
MTRRCAICAKPQDEAYRPFCSKRCADVDLQRWFTGRYAVPAVENETGPDEGEGDLPPSGQGRAPRL